jgi:hypothetical protein
MSHFPKLQSSINSTLNAIQQQPRVNEETKEKYFVNFWTVTELAWEYVGSFVKFCFLYDGVIHDLFYPRMLMSYQVDWQARSGGISGVISQGQAVGESWEDKVKHLIIQQLSVYERDKVVKPRIWLTKKQAEGEALKLSKALEKDIKEKVQSNSEKKTHKTKVPKSVAKPI